MPWTIRKKPEPSFAGLSLSSPPAQEEEPVFPWEEEAQDEEEPAAEPEPDETPLTNRRLYVAVRSIPDELPRWTCVRRVARYWVNEKSGELVVEVYNAEFETVEDTERWKEEHGYSARDGYYAPHHRYCGFGAGFWVAYGEYNFYREHLKNREWFSHNDTDTS